jgi:hypothetical protein
MKCIAKSYKKEPCVFHKEGDTQFCKNHQYMIEYTDDMMSNLELCVGCNKIIIMPCKYYGLLSEKGNGIDKVVPKNGYVIDNCVSCCKMCNFMKNDIDVDVFLQLVEHIATLNNKIQ